MKILIINNFYEPYARGGAERVVKHTAEGFARRGDETIVLTAGPRKYGFSPREEILGGVRVLRFFPLNFYFAGNAEKWPAVLRAKARAFELVNPHPERAALDIIRRESPDFVFTHNLAGIGLRVLAAIRKAGLPHIHFLHDVQLIHPSGLLLWGREAEQENNFARKWYENLTRRIFESPDLVISPSKWLLDFHLSRGFFKNSKTAVLPNPSPNFQYHSLVYDTKRKGVIFAGQLESHKGVDWLIDVVLTKGNDLVLKIAGSGSLEKKVRQAAEANPGKIIFFGKLDEQELFKKFGEVSALVLPSLCYENAPQIISEAHSAGLPVLASRIGGIPELVRDGENGFLFKPGSAAEFIDCAAKIIGLDISPLASAAPSIDQYLDKLLGLCHNKNDDKLKINFQTGL